ncbi:MAG: hypothetical protein JWM93_1171 [Frankiales bacterium]|nr:hypothetical protein [Frankiales bacterium]
MSYDESSRFGMGVRRGGGIRPGCPTRHRHEVRFGYSSRDSGPWTHWQAGELLANVTLDEPPPKATSAAWTCLAVHDAPARRVMDAVTPPCFVAQVHLRPPVGLRYLTLLKPVLDGLIAALQRMPESPPLDPAAASAIHPSLSAERMQDLLAYEPAPLGSSSFLRVGGNSFQWSPSDDKLVALEVLVDNEMGGPFLRAAISSAVPAPG